jgi:uncharacterized protein YndB with AHSA1/START domain
VNRLKRIGLWSAILLVALILMIVGVGSMLPVSHVASGTVAVPQSPADAYAVIADVQSYPRWWKDLSRVEMLPPNAGGRPRFRQFMGSDPVVVEIVEATAPRRFVTRIADPDQPFGGTWTIDVARAGGGSEIAVTERGEVYNPAFRFLSKFVFGHESTIRSFLDALQRWLAA